MLIFGECQEEDVRDLRIDGTGGVGEGVSRLRESRLNRLRVEIVPLGAIVNNVDGGRVAGLFEREGDDVADGDDLAGSGDGAN